MAIYRSIPFVIEAEPYVRGKGLETGFDPCGHCPTFKFTNGDDDCADCDSSRPYVSSAEGKLYVRPGDYIITDSDQKKHVQLARIFDLKFEKVKEVFMCNLSDNVCTRCTDDHPCENKHKIYMK